MVPFFWLDLFRFPLRSFEETLLYIYVTNAALKYRFSIFVFILYLPVKCVTCTIEVSLSTYYASIT